MHDMKYYFNKSEIFIINKTSKKKISQRFFIECSQQNYLKLAELDLAKNAMFHLVHSLSLNLILVINY